MVRFLRIRVLAGLYHSSGLATQKEGPVVGRWNQQGGENGEFHFGHVSFRCIGPSQ